MSSPRCNLLEATKYILHYLVDSIYLSVIIPNFIIITKWLSVIHRLQSKQQSESQTFNCRMFVTGNNYSDNLYSDYNLATVCSTPSRSDQWREFRTIGSTTLCQSLWPDEIHLMNPQTEFRFVWMRHHCKLNSSSRYKKDKKAKQKGKRGHFNKLEYIRINFSSSLSVNRYRRMQRMQGKSSNIH